MYVCTNTTINELSAQISMHSHLQTLKLAHGTFQSEQWMVAAALSRCWLALTQGLGSGAEEAV